MNRITFNVFLPASEKEVIEEEKSAGDTLSGSEPVNGYKNRLQVFV